MIPEPPQQRDRQQALSNTLRTLSTREQVVILLRASRSISHRDKVHVLRTAGLSVLKEHLPSIILHVVIKRILTGTLLWTICVGVAIIMLLLLVIIEQLTPRAVAPIIAVTISFFAGFLISSLVDFGSDIAQFFKTTRTPDERNELLATLNTCEDAEKLAILRALSIDLSKRLPGEPLLTTLITGILLLLVLILILGLTLLLSNFLPMLGLYPFILLVIGVACLIGFFVPRKIRKRLS